jgi:hypothetical protein
VANRQNPQINRSDYAPTIYPPVAQAIFLVATSLRFLWLTAKPSLLRSSGRRLFLPTFRPFSYSATCGTTLRSRNPPTKHEAWVPSAVTLPF